MFVQGVTPKLHSFFSMLFHADFRLFLCWFGCCAVFCANALNFIFSDPAPIWPKLELSYVCSASVYVVEDREIFRHVIIILDIKNCAALGNFDIFILFFPRYVSSLQQKAFTTVSFRRQILNFTHKRIIELKQRQQPTELGHAICSFSFSHPLLLLCV